MITKIATAVADHGMEAATRTGYISTHRSQNEDRVHERKTESIPGDAFVVCSASSIQSPLMLAGEGVTSSSPAARSGGDGFRAARRIRLSPRLLDSPARKRLA